MPEYEYILNNGIVIHKFGEESHYALGIPNDVAEDWLAQDKSRICFFAKYPSDWEKRIATPEVASNEVEGEEVATAQVSAKKRATRKKNK